MKELGRLECPRCGGVTVFRPEVLEEVFGCERVGETRVSYVVSCRYCRAPLTLIVRQPPDQDRDAPLPRGDVL